MSDFDETLKRYDSKTKYDLDKEYQVTQEVRDLFEKRIRKLRKDCWLRMLAGFIIIIYGVLGIRYNTGWYVQWALFTALVGAIVTAIVLLWYWILQAKLTILREIKQLRIDVASLRGSDEKSEQ
jgi:small-conductance mechanosensitive channel